MLNDEGRRARARLAAHRRWHSDDPAELDRLTRECLRELEESRTDAAIDALVAAAPRMTPQQAARIRRFATAEIARREAATGDGEAAT